jgi:hypothetical protein
MQWSKVTHLQTLAIETASQHGLNCAEIASMSKHVISALDDCYITQLLPVTLKVMAGFEKDEMYHVKRTQLLNVPGFELDQLVKCFCPEIDQWRNEQSSAMGDNERDRVPGGESAAHNFLWRVLPMFCLVVFQDGIYWIQDMPNHPISMFIKGLLPLWYVLWANEQRNRIAQLDYSECTQQISRLEPASKAAFDHVNERMQAQVHQLEQQDMQQDMQQEQCEMQREQRDHQIHQLLLQLVNNQQAGQTPQTPRIDEGTRTSLVIAHPATPNVTLLRWLIVSRTWMSCPSQFFQQ